MDGLEIELGIDVLRVYEDLSSRGYTVVFVAVDRELAAVVGVRDRLRDEVRELIGLLKSVGIRSGIVTGDSEVASKEAARELGIDDVYAWLTPASKAELVERMQDSGVKVMFVGDGVNDAVALSKAFVGIAMGSGAEVSKEVGDAVIMSNRLTSIAKLYKLSRAVWRKYIENLLWAFLYNALLIPISMGLLYRPLGLVLRPEVADTAMVLGNISVVLNSLTLLRWR